MITVRIIIHCLLLLLTVTTTTQGAATDIETRTRETLPNNNKKPKKRRTTKRRTVVVPASSSSPNNNKVSNNKVSYNHTVEESSANTYNGQQQQTTNHRHRQEPAIDWISQFLNEARAQNEKLLRIPRDYLSDYFNLFQFESILQNHYDNVNASSSVHDIRMSAIMSELNATDKEVFRKYYKLGLKRMLSLNANNYYSSSDDDGDPLIQEFVEDLAERSYILAHRRFILTPRGLDMFRRLMVRNNALYGRCCRIKCKGSPLLPITKSENVNNSGLKASTRYCFSCGETFYDFQEGFATAWGTSFCHMFLLTYGLEIFPALREYSKVTNNDSTVARNKSSCLLPPSGDEPQVFGFRINSEAIVKYPLL